MSWRRRVRAMYPPGTSKAVGMDSTGRPAAFSLEMHIVFSRVSSAEECTCAGYSRSAAVTGQSGSQTVRLRVVADGVQSQDSQTVRQRVVADGGVQSQDSQTVRQSDSQTACSRGWWRAGNTQELGRELGVVADGGVRSVAPQYVVAEGGLDADDQPR
eukprot:8252008-Pyramimonas_sp.AAC.1